MQFSQGYTEGKSLVSYKSLETHTVQNTERADMCVLSAVAGMCAGS